MNNIIYSYDIVKIKHFNSGLITSSEDALDKLGAIVEFGNEKYNYLNVQLVPKIETSLSKQPIRYGDYLDIFIPATRLRAVKDISTDILYWKDNIGHFNHFKFQIYPNETSNKQIGDVVEYGDNFYFLYNNYLSMVVKGKNLQGVYKGGKGDVFSIIRGVMRKKESKKESKKDNIFKFKFVLYLLLFIGIAPLLFAIIKVKLL